jgi:hypothetical protein
MVGLNGRKARRAGILERGKCWARFFQNLELVENRFREKSMV